MPELAASTLYYIITALVVVLVILVVQVVYVRTSLAKYTRDDYYKQLLVKNEYTTTQDQSCSNFGIYAWPIDTFLAKLLNAPGMRKMAALKVAAPSYFYSVPSKAGFQTIEYASTDVYYIPLVGASTATSKFMNDLLSKRVDYVTWQGGLFRVAPAVDYKQKMHKYLSEKSFDNVISMLDSVSIIALIAIPTLSKLKEQDYAFAEKLDETSPDTIVYSFIGDSRSELVVDALPNSFHVFAYKA